MRKQLAGLLGIALLMMLSAHARADVTVTNNTPDAFQDALDSVTGDGGGTITLTSPILIDDSDVETFDGVSNVVVTGGGTTSLFIVQNGSSLELDNMTLENGSATNGGGIFVSSDSTLLSSNCLFFSNIARGSNGVDAATNGNDGLFQGGNGHRGTSGESAYGGAIFNLGDATFLNCQFVTNSAIGGDGGIGSDGGNGGTRGGNGGSGGSGGSAGGAAIYNGGSVTLVNSTFSANLVLGGVGAAGGAGGGGGIASGLPGNGGTGGIASGAAVLNLANSTNSISACTFSGNTAQGGDSADGGTASAGTGQGGRPGGNAFGGGIDNAGSTYITNSSFFQNTVSGGNGGNGGSGGRAGNGGNGGNAIGGGLYNAANVWVVNCTFSMGSAVGGTNGAPGSGAAAGRNGRRGASQGGNIANVAKKKAGLFHLENSIIATNLSGGGGFGKITDEGYNISADKSIKLKQSTSKTRTNPLIGPLADNGGPTETMALLNNSPAIDQIPPDLAPSVDQRGDHRPEPLDGQSDIGSFELNTNTVRIVQPPTNAIAFIGSNVTFTVVAQGTPPLFYQWLFNGSTNVPANVTNGFNGSSFTITNVQTNNAGSFQVIITNDFNAVTSSVVTLTVISSSNSPPIIIVPPQNQTITQGSNATFSVTAEGSTPLSYQWAFAGSTTTYSNILGQTNATFTITNAQPANQGNYLVTITNNFGSTNASVALLVNSTNTDEGPPPFPGALRLAPAPVSGPVPLVPLMAAQPKGSPSPTVNFTFQTQAETKYVIEFKRSLSDPAWIPIATNIGTGAWLTNELPTTNHLSGFYRVRTE